MKVFEKFLHRKLSSRLQLGMDGGLSEWIMISPPDAMSQIEEFIANGFEFQGEIFWNENGEISLDMMSTIKTPCIYDSDSIEYCFGSKVCASFLSYLARSA